MCGECEGVTNVWTQGQLADAQQLDGGQYTAPAATGQCHTSLACSSAPTGQYQTGLRLGRGKRACAEPHNPKTHVASSLDSLRMLVPVIQSSSLQERSQWHRT